MTTWSISRDQTLHTCERRYYFQYLAPAKTTSRNPWLREIALLKRLKTIAMWQGGAFHSMVADYINQARGSHAPDSSSLVERLTARMRQEWASSQRASASVPSPASRLNDDGVVLFEHAYEENVSDADCMASIANMAACVGRFLTWAQKTDFLRIVREARRAWIEPPVFGPQAPGFLVDGVQVVVKVDAALRHADGRFEIYDWKTARRPPRPGRQLSDAEFQMSVYQLWPHLSFDVPVDEIRARLVFLGGDEAQEQVLGFDANLRDYALAVIRRSIARVRRFEHHETEGELPLDDGALSIGDFDFAAFPFACRKCSFKRLCQAALTQ